METYAHLDPLLHALASTIADFRVGEIAPITPQHVHRWIRQFEPSEQPVILEELRHVFERTYFSKARVRAALDALISDESIFGSRRQDGLLETKFLAVQENGQSQHVMLDMLDQSTRRKYGLPVSECGSVPKRYIYLDDALFTGNKARYDLEPHIPNLLPGTTLYLCFLAVHTHGRAYALSKLRNIARRHGVTIRPWCIDVIYNDPTYLPWHEAIWPRMTSRDDVTREYLNALQSAYAGTNWRPRLYRPITIPRQETLFSTPYRRDVLEQAFLRTGAKIWSKRSRRDTSLSMRPLGFEKLPSLGFGSLVVTFRNVPNNCPLALWWSLGGWVPLFPPRR